MRSRWVYTLCLWALVAECILTLPLPCYAQGKKQVREIIHFDFRGLHMGDPVPPNIALVNGCDQEEQGSPPPDRMQCLDPVDLIGNISVGIFYTFLRGRLAGLMILFKSDEFATLVGGYREKFGNPHELKKQPVQTKVGATFINEIAIWHTDSGDLIVRKYGSDINKGYATIYSHEGLKDLEARSNSDAKKAASGL